MVITAKTQTSVNNEFKNDLTISESTAGTSAALTVENTNNTFSTSHARVTIKTGGSSSGDPFIHFDNGSTDYVIGLDNSSDDAIIISKSSTLGTTNVARCETSGEWTYPLQSGFNVYPSAAVSNVSGTGTTYKPLLNTELFDNNNDYNTTTHLFTAPTDGIYFLISSVDLANGSTCASISSSIICPSTSYIFQSNRPDSSRAGTGHGGVHVELDQGDTVYIITNGWYESSDILDMFAGPELTYFCGVLLQ